MYATLSTQPSGKYNGGCRVKKIRDTPTVLVDDNEVPSDSTGLIIERAKWHFDGRTSVSLEKRRFFVGGAFLPARVSLLAFPRRAKKRIYSPLPSLFLFLSLSLFYRGGIALYDEGNKADSKGKNTSGEFIACYGNNLFAENTAYKNTRLQKYREQ